MGPQITITMKIITCSCGGVYEIPDWIYRYSCPLCSGKIIDEKDSYINSIINENRALRGVITRMKNKQAG